MSRRRPPRAWVGSPLPVDGAELAGPRGLTAEVLDGRAAELDERAAPLDDRTELDDGSVLEDGTALDRPAALALDPASALPERAAFYWRLLTEARQQRILSVVFARLASVTVVLDRLIDPHNTAAILRTSEGLGLAAVHVVPHEIDDALAHRRVTQDAHKWVDVQQHADGAAAARALRARGFEVWVGHLDEGARLYTDLPADRPVALLFGNEHEGPQPATLAECTGSFRIPMAGFTQSFNVSVAAGMALSFQTRARRLALGRAGDLPPAERVLLQARFTLLAAKLSRRLKR